ncbi:MAG: hypothetical protein DMG14_19105 [Acidobacteria bacterium]|nr:MAG: hypothetical protein DMG14_19105 [Acidobacteriota bacterium]
MPAVDHQFEPMSIGMLLDRAVRLYTQNFPLMLGITAVLNVPIFFLSILPRLLPFTGYTWVAILSSGLVGFATLLVVYPLVTGATTKAVSDKYLGNPVTVGSALKEAWGCVGTLLLTQWVAAIIVGVGFLLLVIPGILWMLSYTLIAPVVMIEASDRRFRQVYSLTGETKGMATQSMDRGDIRRRSWKLVKGNRGKVFVVLIVLFLLRALLSSGANWVTAMSFSAGPNVGFAVQSIIGDGINVLTSPLQTIAVTLLYYDFRIRKEGFDLEMLSRAMGTSTENA